MLDSRQGVGWFVAGDPLAPEPGPPGHDRGAAGRERPASPSGASSSSPSCRPSPACAALLGCDQVLRVRRLNLADGEPFALGHRVVPGRAGRAPVARGRRAVAVLRAARRAAGRRHPDDRCSRRRASGRRQARHPAGLARAAVRADHEGHDGQPVLLSVHIFPGHRTEFVVDLTQAEPSIAPTGLRLVE